MLHRGTEKLREDQPHDQQHQQWREQAPRHTQYRSFVFLFEIAFYQFLKQELVFFQLLYHRCLSRSVASFFARQFILQPCDRIFDDISESDFSILIHSQNVISVGNSCHVF